DGVFIGPEMLGHGFISDDHGLCACAVGVTEFAAGDERYAQSLKKRWSYIINLRQRPAVSGSFILALRENGARKCRDQRRSIGDGRGFDAGRGFGALDGGAEKLLAMSFIIVQSAKI